MIKLRKFTASDWDVYAGAETNDYFPHAWITYDVSFKSLRDGKIYDCTVILDANGMQVSIYDEVNEKDIAWDAKMTAAQAEEWLYEIVANDPNHEDEKVFYFNEKDFDFKGTIWTKSIM